ncbi:response regulator transcription factor [Lewinella sp. IMCC34191]|uniref:response regulator transcription factor n=1 Tax=Lewinella sp. IMCC34191 TaxID=2259172 RepID=UPI000E287F62|nr:response regulator transcription factor [Lewinella sp. IMCC34191]
MKEAAPRILIVEDEVIVATEIEHTLRNLGYRIAGRTGNGDDALDLLAGRDIDLALLDINIKGSRDGIDLARIIRQRYNFPFVYLTAYCDRDTLDKVKETMPYGYIVKPFNREELLASVELALHRHAATSGDKLPNRQLLNKGLPCKLTEREYEVLRLLDGGLTYRAVGERLFISTNTVKYYQKAIFQKLGATSRLEALRMARNGVK